ncbi:DUF305 domain-containing protein [Nocardioides donggukensis]|uniref:DUF305 domain-containing protein n=1 Tax=Nocardioides donggukensis TaxID=2774019 RepID=A0A927K500_9ACTN|nr:DUF305 domain-containing protein [Nocardioides donggukensis]MBD8869991.1 DUF305 domain-containing protein [Nocardioides donggukensis]
MGSREDEVYDVAGARRAAPRAIVVALVAVLTLAGCTAGEGADDPAQAGAEPTATSSADTEALSKILQPGRPGEANATLDPDTTLEETEWNEVDARFVQMMIPHHAQALEMTALARTRARDERVASLARRIEGTQGPEIQGLAAWLQARGLGVPEVHDHSTHDHDGDDDEPMMAGMLSPAQMDELAAAKGGRFDRLFLTGMIAHHQGAVDMADEQMTEGADLLASEIASEIFAGQSAEIDRMRELRSAL